MIDGSKLWNRWVSLLVSLVIIAMARPALAQDDEDEVEAPAVVQRFMMSDENFDQWVFGGMGNAGAARNRLAMLLTLQIADIEGACSLRPAQKKTLELAGRGDVKRFFESVEEKRRKFQLVKNDQNKFGVFYQELQPLQMKFNSGLFGDGSLYHKTIRSTLDPAQAMAYEKTQKDRARFQYQAKIERVISQLDATIGFRVDQRRKLVTLLVEETPAPRKFGQYDYYVVLYNAASLPVEKIKPIFDDAQWRVLTKHFAQARSMEPFLKANGFAPVAIAMPVVRPAQPVRDAVKPDQAKVK
jgi:hypothetical protein